jgi:tetratricopeptide (TPR) repeat protein
VSRHSRISAHQRPAGVACVVLSLAWCGLGYAQSPADPVAAELKQKGDAAIEAGLYDEALDAYSRALTVEPTPALHYNRGRALQALGRNAEALAEFESFERAATSELKAAVPRLPEMMAAVRSRIAELTVSCDVPGATLHLAERELRLPQGSALRLDPGDYTLEVTAPSHDPWSLKVSLRAGEARAVVATPLATDERGLLSVTSTVVGATVQIDGQMMGTVPVDARLAPGEHRVLVSHPDFHQGQSQVVLKAREQRQLKVELDRLPYLYERWWFWTALGVLAAGGVALGVALSTEQSASSGDIPPGRISAPLVTF